MEYVHRHKDQSLVQSITGSVAVWYSPPSEIATISSGQVSNIDNTGFTAALVTINNSRLTTDLSFIATTDKNRLQVSCSDLADGNSTTCIIMTSGMSLRVLYITNMYYHYKVLQMMLLQD